MRCLLVISCFPFLMRIKRDCRNSCHCVRLDISQTGLCRVYVWSGLGSGKRLDWISCIGAKCNTAPNHLSTPTHANLVPPTLSGIFPFTRLTLITSPFCKQAKAGFVFERMNYMTPVTFPHLPAFCWWKSLCHALTCKNFPMKERGLFYPLAAAVWEGLGSL